MITMYEYLCTLTLHSLSKMSLWVWKFNSEWMIIPVRFGLLFGEPTEAAV